MNEHKAEIISMLRFSRNQLTQMLDYITIDNADIISLFDEDFDRTKEIKSQIEKFTQEVYSNNTLPF